MQTITAVQSLDLKLSYFGGQPLREAERRDSEVLMRRCPLEARNKGTNAKCCHDAIFQSTDQLFDGKLRSTTATAGHHHADTTPIYIIGTLDSQRLLFVI